MITSNQLSAGMTIRMNKNVYRVESAVKVNVPKGASFIKTKLRDLVTDEISEKNFKFEQEVEEVSLVEHRLEFLYPEKDQYLFLDIDNLEQVFIPPSIFKDLIHYLKEGIEIKALFYGDTVFSVEFPQFLELMVVKTKKPDEKLAVGNNNTKEAELETGAKLQVPLFIEAGDVIKVDVYSHEYIQRV